MQEELLKQLLTSLCFAQPFNFQMRGRFGHGNLSAFLNFDLAGPGRTGAGKGARDKDVLIWRDGRAELSGEGSIPGSSV